jgi:hypothetical protein
MSEEQLTESAGRFADMKSDDLMAIWRESDEEKYSFEEFNAIESLLKERGFHFKARKAKLKGLLGWLLIPRILLVPYAILISAGLLIAGIAGVADSGAPASESGMIWMLPLGIISAVVSLTTAYLFYNERKKAPIAMIIMLALCVCLPLGIGIVRMLLVGTYDFVYWSIMMSIIGIPSIAYIFYFIYSKRVRRTFVK